MSGTLAVERPKDPIVFGSAVSPVLVWGQNELRSLLFASLSDERKRQGAPTMCTEASFFSPLFPPRLYEHIDKRGESYPIQMWNTSEEKRIVPDGPPFSCDEHLEAFQMMPSASPKRKRLLAFFSLSVMCSHNQWSSRYLDI